MPINRYAIILLALLTILAIGILQLTPATAQGPAGFTLTPTETEETATATRVTATATEPVITVTPTDTPVTVTVTQVTVTVTEPVITVTWTPTGEITFPPPFDTETPTPGEPGRRSTRTPPVLPETGQSPIDGGFPVQGLFTVLLFVLIGWFFVRSIAGRQAPK